MLISPIYIHAVLYYLVKTLIFPHTFNILPTLDEFKSHKRLVTPTGKRCTRPESDQVGSTSKITQL